jgi:hypothetical protein
MNEFEEDNSWGFFVELDDLSKHIIIKDNKENKENKENKFNKYKKYYKQILPNIKEEEEQEQEEEIQRQDEELYRLEEELYRLEEDEIEKIEKIEKKVKNKIKSLFCYLGATIFIISLLAILC